MPLLLELLLLGLALLLLGLAHAHEHLVPVLGRRPGF